MAFPLSQDNRPLADEAWKRYWQLMSKAPGDWKSGQQYNVGDLVMAKVPNGLIYITVPIIFRCILEHTAADNNFPVKGAEAKNLLGFAGVERESNLWSGRSGIGWTSGLYQCLQANTATIANRPRPWDKMMISFADWPFRLLEYAGPNGTSNRITIEHYEFKPHLPTGFRLCYRYRRGALCA